jgi:hypothetical protein
MNDMPSKGPEYGVAEAPLNYRFPTTPLMEKIKLLVKLSRETFLTDAD